MIRISPNGRVSMGLDDFAALDYGQVCQALGLRPSQPYTRADGTKARRPRRRRSRRP